MLLLFRFFMHVFSPDFLLCLTQCLHLLAITVDTSGRLFYCSRWLGDHVYWLSLLTQVAGYFTAPDGLVTMFIGYHC